MAYPGYVREKARDLRREKQLTIDEIAERLALSRTTVYYWIRDLPLERRTRPQKLAQRRASSSNRRRFKRQRDEAYELGRWEFLRLRRESTFTDFICLYIGEGYKRNRNTVSLANSDPAVVMLANRWIRHFSRNPVTYSVQVHADQDLGELAAFWGAHLGVRASEIKFVVKSYSGRLRKRVWRCRYGVINVRASDTLFRARLQGWIDRLKEEWLDSPEIGA
jgi:hypothetical protein